MKDLLKLVVVLFMAGFGAFIGFDRDITTGNVNASPPDITFLPRISEAPKRIDPLNLTVDFNTGQLSVDNAVNGEVNVRINQEPIIKYVPKYITLKSDVAYVEDNVRITKLMNKLQPLKMPKLVIPFEGTDREE